MCLRFQAQNRIDPKNELFNNSEIKKVIMQGFFFKVWAAFHTNDIFRENSIMVP